MSVHDGSKWDPAANPETDVFDKHRADVSSYTFVFFFQAEDGIRDLTVTGVQTCALPIWAGSRCAPLRGHEAVALNLARELLERGMLKAGEDQRRLDRLQRRAGGKHRARDRKSVV